MSSQYEIPSKPYSLNNTKNPIEQIYQVTNEFNSISKEMERQLLKRLSSRTQDVVVGTFNAPNKYISSQVNGNGGFFLKKTTTESDVYLIWYDMKDATYVFWGPTVYKVCDAMNRIRIRIIKYVQHIRTDESPSAAPKPKYSFNIQRERIASSPPPKEECTSTTRNEKTIYRSISVAPYAEEYAAERSMPIELKEYVQQTDVEPKEHAQQTDVEPKEHAQQTDAEPKEPAAEETLSESDIEFINSVRKNWKNHDHIAQLLEKMDSNKINKWEFMYEADSYLESCMREMLNRTLNAKRK
jgi:hypothetical protein